MTDAPTELPKIHALPAPIIDVPTPDGWVILVRPVGVHQPGQQGKFNAEYWAARPGSIEPADGDDVMVASVPLDSNPDFDELMKSHRDVTEGMVAGAAPMCFDTVLMAAGAAIAAARAQGAQIDKALEDYVLLLAKEADALREGVPAWGDVVFKRDALEAMRTIRCDQASVAFVESDDGKRRVDVDMVYRGERYEVSYKPDAERDDERQDVILRAIRELPERHAADQAAVAIQE